MQNFFSKMLRELEKIWTTIFNRKRRLNENEVVKTILCVDDDKDFCRFIEKLGVSIGVKVEKAFLIDEAKDKIDSASEGYYQAYVIDGHLPDGSGFDLIAWMREEKGIGAPIGFLSRIYQDALSFRNLKEIYSVEYVLDKPLEREAVRQFLIRLCHKETVRNSKLEIQDIELEELKINYDKTILDKVERVERLILNVQKEPSESNLQQLNEEIHKISGSAGSYGYPEVSLLCREMEKKLLKQINALNAGEFDMDWLASLDEFFTKFKYHFQIQQK